jgi:hypothetical protein
MRRDLTHLVQFYGSDEPALIDNVVSFLGDNSIVIATKDHADKLRAALAGYRDVLYLDAYEMLAKFMVGGRPNRALFDATIGKAVRERAPSGDLHAYGEMVAILWEAGNEDAAIRLEELWNELLASIPFALYCSYPLEGQDERIAAVHSGWVDA